MLLCMARGRLAVWHRAAALQENVCVRQRADPLCRTRCAGRSENVNPLCECTVEVSVEAVLLLAGGWI